MQLLALVLLAAVAGIVTAETPTDKKVKSSAQPEAAKRRGPAAPRGRRRNIWSYNLGHRSLAFLVAGDVEVGTPPAGTVDPAPEYRCLGCCGAGWSPSGRGVADQDVANAIGQSVLRREELAGLGAEPNSVADRCLGCCQQDVTPAPGHRGGVRAGAAAGAERGPRGPTTYGQRKWQAKPEQSRNDPCGRRGCPLGSEASSSSEEDVVGVRGRRTDIKPGDPCRYLGCRSPLGSFEDSSSEED
ncbi:uncharacterized protein LOC128496812 [Spea bombifrons]|uniref:uncharacterized protein LOC128496812 n=1 Tax=Spea bombifrons TaxID=233779 RepID=UPI00234BB667|nr:uncharacterized protein LOC128496812 [Spea bombifrons]